MKSCPVELRPGFPHSLVYDNLSLRNKRTFLTSKADGQRKNRKENTDV